ncbi:lantibiotic dehydratase C-terminal domain-containing protein [Sphingobacterium sp. HSC-15S19]|uniref:lantibiotic dehydratase C-terminal domain-containing protein n=1 Tax=Sphingobacterium sp. HSC-15S19 TaxID=2910971 RepID=UPI003D21DDF8
MNYSFDTVYVTVSTVRIIGSLTHMLLNRIFFTKQREQEMVIYHFLAKILNSEFRRTGC